MPRPNRHPLPESLYRDNKNVPDPKWKGGKTGPDDIGVPLDQDDDRNINKVLPNQTTSKYDKKPYSNPSID